MKTCERWDLIDGMTPCPHEAHYCVVYDDGVKLALCEGHTDEVEDVVQSVTRIASSRLVLERHLSLLAGGAVTVLRGDEKRGVVLRGATARLASMCGFTAAARNHGRTYFTSTKVRVMLLAVKEAA